MIFGSKIAGLTYGVAINGGFLQLIVYATTPIDVECFRLSSVSRGAIQVISSGGGGGSSYTLPIATDVTLGGVKQGAGITIDFDGTISASGSGYTLPVASASVSGGVKVGSGLAITAGVLSATGAVSSVNTYTGAVVLTAADVGAIATGSLATVASTGSYTDLTNKPTIPADQVQSDWNAVMGLGAILNKPTIPTDYTLPAATGSLLGGIKVGTGLAITVGGVLSATGGGGGGAVDSVNGNVGVVVLTAADVGAVPAGSLATVAASGDYTDLINTPTAYSLPTASSSVLGGIKIGSGLAIDGGGVVTASGGGSLTPATTVALGGVIIGAGLNVDGAGVISAAGSTSSSITKIFTQASHGFTVGQSIARVGGVWVLAKADVEATAEVAGIINSVPDANNFGLVFTGYLSGLSGLTDGSTYFLSDTVAGGHSTTSPSATNTVSKPIFIAISATEAIVIQSRGILN
jgi:hypothetical protein